MKTKPTLSRMYINATAIADSGICVLPNLRTAQHAAVEQHEQRAIQAAKTSPRQACECSSLLDSALSPPAAFATDTRSTNVDTCEAEISLRYRLDCPFDKPDQHTLKTMKQQRQRNVKTCVRCSEPRRAPCRRADRRATCAADRATRRSRSRCQTALAVRVLVHHHNVV